MIEISRISQTKKGRYALFCGDEFLFSLSPEVFADSDVHEGDLLDDVSLEMLRRKSDSRAAVETAMGYLARRSYGEQEMYQKLLLKYDPHSAAAAVAQVKQAGLLDDAQFAADMAEAMVARGKSPAEIMRKLHGLRIDEEMARAAVDAHEVDEATLAKELVQKRYADQLMRGRRQQVMAALARRGFAHRDIVSAVEAISQELEIPETQLEEERI